MKQFLKIHQTLADWPRKWGPPAPLWLGWAQALCHIIPSCHVVCDCLILYIMKICMDFGSYDAFLSSDVPKMVNQQNLWNLLVINTYLLYLEWNIGMLAVDICILWPPASSWAHDRGDQTTRTMDWWLCNQANGNARIHRLTDQHDAQSLRSLQ
jgi:hypothetical protein